MFKRIIILVVLSLILLMLGLVRAHTTAPVNTTSTKNNDPVEYVTKEYKINDINGNQYYGKADDGTGIHFSAENIPADVQIRVNDKVICYFEKNNLGKGLVKVEKITP